MFGLKFNPFKSWTVGGVALAIGTSLVGHFDPNGLSEGARYVLTAAGAIAATIGARNAVAKAALAVVEGLAAKASE